MTRTVNADQFASALSELVADVTDDVIDASGEACAKSTRAGVRNVKAHASQGGLTEWSDEYVGGFSSHIERGAMTVGEIGNKAKPGLVHLLEKGHAKLNGRRTNAYPHMAPAFDEIKDDYIKRLEKSVGIALGGD